MRADDSQRVTIARDYPADIRRTGVEQLPPSRLLIEAAESHRQLGILLAVIDQAPAEDDAARKLAAVRAVLDAFDWEFHDRQLALEEIDRITTPGGA